MCMCANDRQMLSIWNEIIKLCKKTKYIKSKSYKKKGQNINLKINKWTDDWLIENEQS